MIPILYKKGASNYSNNGIGHLKDAISCKVTEERHGDYLLTLQYPISGAWYSDIVEGAVVKAKANETSELQLFRIYKSSKPMKGVVTFYGEHISYDLKGLPLCALSMRGTTPGAALTAGFSASVLSHGFTAWSDMTTLNNINITKPRSLRNFCGGEAGSVLSVWGGEFEFDNFVVKLHKHRGANNGVVINYGKNLTDAKQERNISDCYTHFCPYAIKKTETRNAAGEVTETSEETITLSDGVIELVNPENIGHTKAYTLDISDKFADGEEMNEANLRAHAEEYIASHKLGVPKVNITLSFMQIWDSPEYSKIAVFERVALCDTVTVRFSDLGIDAEAKVIKTEYDSLEERFSKIEVGDAKSTLADTVTSIEESITDTKKNLTESENAASVALQNAIIEATNKITGNSGGYVVLSPANNPQEILIMNTPDKETATRVWRWNSSGLGYSKSGYNGEYGLAMTMDGAIVADFITAGTLNAINITGCTITGGSLNINDRFTVDAEGNVRTEGEIIATSGIIGGCEIKDGKLVITSANITGTLTIGQLPDSVAETSDIPTKVSELSNDSGYQNRTGVVSIIDGRITADYVEALEISVAAAQITGKLTAGQIDASELKVSAANITGTLTIGQLPDSVAETSDIPTKVSELSNDSGYQNRTGVVSIIDGRITADYVEALEISVAAANITGKLTASQINANGISASNVTISGNITATSGNFSNCTIDDSCTINGTITANKICANEGAYSSYSATGDISFIGGTSTSIAQYIMRVTNAQNTSKKAYVCVYDVQGSMNAAMSTISTGSSGYLTTSSVSIVDTTVMISGESLIISAPISARKTAIFSGQVTMNAGFTGRSSYSSELRHSERLGVNGGNYAFLQFYRNSYGSDFLACSLFHNYDNTRFYMYSWDNGISVGAASGHDSYLVGTWYCNGSIINSSDANAKNSIADISEKYSEMFDSLRPRLYKYNDGTSGRIHTGFIAQEVESAALNSGITREEFAAICVSEEGKEREAWGLRYEEFIALNTYEIQKLKKRLSELESLIKAQ